MGILDEKRLYPEAVFIYLYTSLPHFEDEITMFVVPEGSPCLQPR